MFVLSFSEKGFRSAVYAKLKERESRESMQASKQALAHHLAWGTCPAQSHSNLTYTNAGGISEYLRFSPLVRRPGAPRLAARQRPIHSEENLLNPT